MPLYQFERAKTIPEVLEWLRAGAHRTHRNLDWTRIAAEVERPLSRAEREALDRKWPAATFLNIRRVPESYPSWALRNVRVETWSVQDARWDARYGWQWSDFDDLALVMYRGVSPRDTGRSPRRLRRAGNSLKLVRWACYDRALQLKIVRKRSALAAMREELSAL